MLRKLGWGRASSRRILYVCPDYTEPSWGIGMLYTHVEILRAEGLDATIVHSDPRFRPGWLSSSAPVLGMAQAAAEGSDEQIVVVPEVLARDEATRSLAGRRIVFVQGTYTVPLSLGSAPSFVALGFEHAIAILPHVRHVLERHFATPATVVPPCIAEHFFTPEATSGERKSRIVLVPPKLPGWDSDVVGTLLPRLLESTGSGWSVEELRGLTHTGVAELLRASQLMINVNVGEAFNTTVPEAMASGCVVLCYEAFGGQDFLRDGENAFVFPNHYAYPLLERLEQLLAPGAMQAEKVQRMRHAALETARVFSRGETARRLIEFFSDLLSAR